MVQRFCSHFAQIDRSPAQLVAEQKLQLLKIFPIQVLIEFVQHHPEENKSVVKRTKVSPVTQLLQHIPLLLPVLGQEGPCICFLWLPAICFQAAEEISATDSVEQLGEERTILQKTFLV